MSHATNTPITFNRLWIARKQSGYPQKWVASLLGHRSVSVVSEYESGRKLPTLPVALKLSRIYRTPLPQLFPDLCKKVEREVESVKQRCEPIRRRDEERRQWRSDGDRKREVEPVSSA